MTDQIIEQIIQDPLFLRLKKVVENGRYHDHEDVYSHVIKVKDIAQREIKADFITNSDAKKAFLQFIGEDFHGYKRGDLMILIALLHDIGKALSVKESKNTRSILVTNEEGNTWCPGHEYWGSTIVGQILRKLSFSEAVIDYVATVIRNHDIYNPAYFDSKEELSFNLLINDVKSRAEGKFIESLFNIYCDCFAADVFQKAKEKIIKVFNDPDLYERREYVLT